MKQRRTKARLPILQRVSFSLGHILNDLILSVFSSYLLIYQTKVLGLSSGVVGLLWLVPNAVDAFLALAVGYVCDNVTIPWISHFYGRRKTWHLVGCLMVGVSFPFLLMPCLVCDKDSQDWAEAVYYITITQVCYMGYCFTHANHLALIPEMAKRPSEMVELGAISSAVTFVSGIFIYGVIWALLNDSSDAALSASQQTDFTHLAIIVVSVGAFFSFLFHIGTREPKSRKSRTGEKKLEKGSPKSLHSFSAIDIKETNEKPPSYIIDSLHTTTHAQELRDVIQSDNSTALVNPTFVADAGDIEAKICEKRLDIELSVAALEGVILRSATGDKGSDTKTFDNEDTVSSCSSGYGEGEISSGADTFSTDTESADIYMPDTYLDGVAHHSSLFLRSRPGSRISRITPLSTPRLPRSAHYKPSQLASPTPSEQNGNNSNIAFSREQLTFAGAEEYLAQSLSGIKASEEEGVANGEERSSDLVIIERGRREPCEKGSWGQLFKNPMFYKIGFAYMCTRMAQNVTNAYFPIFLTDNLHFGKQAIAYFPLVTLVSGVFASFATKTLNKLLGNKWTFCLGALVVMGSSVSFYSLTEASRSATYAPAVLSGCGTSIMFVTTLALAAELVDKDRSSGAFVMASMGFLAKVVLGTLFFFLQEFYPKSEGSIECVDCSDYVRHVFSLTPGVSALMGLVGFFVFIPATVKCKHITHTMDAETQTDGFPYDLSLNAHADETTGACAHGSTPQITIPHETEEGIHRGETVECGNIVVTHL